MNEGTSTSNLLDYVSSFSAFGSRAKHKVQFYFVFNLLTRNNERWSLSGQKHDGHDHDWIMSIRVS